MNLWRYAPDIEHYRTIDFVNRADTKLFVDHFMGRPIPDSWPTISVYYDREWEDPRLTKAQRQFASRYKDQPKGDFPVLPGGVPVFSEKAVQALEPLIKGSVEIIPLACEEDRLFLVNVIDVVDCLDQQRSVLKRFSNGAIMKVLHYAFKNEALLDDKGMVMLAGVAVHAFVTDGFKRLIEAHDLKGLLWDPLP